MYIIMYMYPHKFIHVQCICIALHLGLIDLFNACEKKRRRSVTFSDVVMLLQDNVTIQF